MKLPPPVTDLRKQIETAKDRELVKVKKAAEGTIDRLNSYLEALLKTPEKFTNHTLYSEEMPLWAHHKNGYDEYLNVLRNLLGPLGYRIEQSHDGGGMYSTVIIRWDVQNTKRGAPRGMLNPYGDGEDYPEPMIRDAKLLRG